MAALDRTLEQPGARLRFHDPGGPGVPVVLTHGAGMDHTSFLPQAEAIRDAGDRVILWDMRGHGQSALAPGTRFSATDALDDLAALLDACAGNIATAMPRWAAHEGVQEHAIRGAGHVVMLDAPQSTSDALLGVLEGMRR